MSYKIECNERKTSVYVLNHLGEWTCCMQVPLGKELLYTIEIILFKDKT